MPGRRQDYARLARYVNERMDELGLRPKDIPIAGGPSPNTFRLVRKALPLNPDNGFEESTLNRIDPILGWEVGSLWNVALGGEPVEAHTGIARPRKISPRRPVKRAAPAPRAVSPPADQPPDDLIERGREHIRRLPGLTDEQREAMLGLHEQTVVRDWQAINRMLDALGVPSGNQGDEGESSA